MRKVIAIEALGSMFMFVNEFGYERARNVYPESLIVLVEAVKKLYDGFVEGMEESVLSEMLENVLSKIIEDSVLSKIIEDSALSGGLDNWKDEKGGETVCPGGCCPEKPEGRCEHARTLDDQERC